MSMRHTTGGEHWVCMQCGLPVRQPGASKDNLTWKHSGGGKSRPSCGQVPDPVLVPDPKWKGPPDI